jgi:hypothetical protein
MRLRFALLAVTTIGLLVAAAHRRAVAPPPLHLDPHRSFAVTDQAILDGFSFERVMSTLVERGGSRTQTALSLFQQWFDTQNPKPGLATASAPHCDDFLVDGKPSFNGFERRCPTPEGSLAKVDPFVPAQFIPLALVNRFDLAAADGSHCGQYRIIFARTVNTTPNIGGIALDRLNAIFEAVLPNPDPAKGVAGCRPVAQFWAGLSQLGSIAERRALLEQFFFTGIPGFAPVFHPDHYGRSSGGGIRTFHSTVQSGVLPRFYQFRLEKKCSGGRCSLVMEPDVLENLPRGRLFDGRESSALARRFRDEFVRQVETLAIPDENRFFLNLSREFLVAESSLPDDPAGYVGVIPFLAGQLTEEGRAFNDRIQSELSRVKSKLTPTDVIFRAQTLNCAGCHLRGDSLFEHVSFIRTEPGESGPRFSISGAMRGRFIPHRMNVLRKFLESGEFERSSATIGGGRVVQ